MRDTIDQYIDGVKNLPPAPTLMIELMNLLKKPDRDIDQLVAVMSHDPSLTAEILKRCNSAFIGGEQPATDLFEATFRLGFHEVYRVASALFGSRAIQWSGAKDGLDVGKVWEHSALTAVAASEIAKQMDEAEGIAFTAGLLHDVGKVVLASAEGGRYSEICRRSAVEGDLRRAEHDAFGFDHSEIGGRLLARWQLPPSIVAPVQHHHAPQEANEFQRSAAVLSLADSIAYCLVSGNSANVREMLGENSSLQILGLELAQVEEIIQQLRENADKVKALFNTRSAPR